MWVDNEQKEILSEYKIDGSIAELHNVVYPNALVAISDIDVISVLSKSKTNYIRVGSGDTIFKAYENGYVKGRRCKLVHIYFPEDGLNMRDLDRFICGFEEDIVFGYTKDETINSGLRMVMIFN